MNSARQPVVEQRNNQHRWEIFNETVDYIFIQISYKSLQPQYNMLIYIASYHFQSYKGLETPKFWMNLIEIRLQNIDGY